MRHERTGVILSTGGDGIVKAAYSSGKPAFGVGPGNVPVLIDTSADLEDAIPKIVAGKSFDYGTVCSSEQAIVAEASLRDRILACSKRRRPTSATTRRQAALGKLLIMPNWTVNPQCVGQAPTKIAQMAGFRSPARHLHHLLRAHRRRQATSALRREALAGALAVLRARFQSRARHLLRAAEIRRRRPHRRHLLAERRPHARIRPAHARQAHAGEYARAAGFHRHHHQRLPLHDARLRRGSRQQHFRQRRSAAPDQHQAPGLRGAQAGRSLRDAARLQRRSGSASGRGLPQSTAPP